MELNNSLIATVFKFDTENTKPIFHKDLSKLNIENLTDNVISEQLSVKRIIKLYPQKDTIVLLSLTNIDIGFLLRHIVMLTNVSLTSQMQAFNDSRGQHI